MNKVLKIEEVSPYSFIRELKKIIEMTQSYEIKELKILHNSGFNVYIAVIEIKVL